jgi:hypothetical protein
MAFQKVLGKLMSRHGQNVFVLGMGGRHAMRDGVLNSPAMKYLSSVDPLEIARTGPGSAHNCVCLNAIPFIEGR